ncbi:MAG: hypothetical protein K9G36_03145 [Crocinitomicaceae bacterium]|jgi:hypothetical protein|nr:hypothetical protein [Crocinitomicaceae bacterium]MCF8443723.1 hypothetical protein [Crocinitomicaceae bacterium]
MKKQQLILVTLLFPLIGFSQPNDTLFIQKDSIYGTYQSIYIAKNNSSQLYIRLLDLNFGEFDSESYSMSLSYLKEENLILKKNTPVIPETHWIPLVQYNKKLFAYYPCDFYSFYKVSINDSTFIEWTGEGPIANQIMNQKKGKKNTFEFDLCSMYGPIKTVIIHIINPKKGIAVFETVSSNKERYYSLMIAASKINRVPLIVNQCDFQKQRELNFEEPDFNKILNH